MEPISFALAVIAEARTLGNSIQNRLANYRAGPETFRALSISVDRLAKHIASVESRLSSSPDAVPTGISEVFRDTLSEVRDILKYADQTMEKSFSKAFSASGSSAMGKLKSRARRTFRATSLRSKMDALNTQMETASNKLLHLISVLSSALKVEEVLVPKIDNLSLVSPTEDVFLPSTNTPALTDAVKLDFDAKDLEGNRCTPEGILKQHVLSSESSRNVTAAAGVMVYGVVGMAGVGKTVALVGLASDREIRDRFP